MSVDFTTTMLAVTSTPFTALPYTVGFWLRNTTIAAGAAPLFAWRDNTAADQYSVYRNGANINMWAGLGDLVGPVTVVGRWLFVTVRVVTASNKRIQYLDVLGNTGEFTSTDATAFVGNQWSIGGEGAAPGTAFYDGHMAEFWMTDTDIQPGGAILANTFVRQLAFFGPFSVPQVAANLVYYRSFRATMNDSNESAREVFHGKYGKLNWGQPTGMTNLDHPPLNGGYRWAPGRRSRRIIPI